MVVAVTKFRVGAGVLVLASALSCSPATPAPRVGVEPILDIPRIAVDGGAVVKAETRFVRVPPRVGQKTHISVSAVSETPNGGPQPVGAYVEQYDSELAVEVLSVESSATTEVSVTFLRNVYVSNRGDMPTAIDGKSYLVGVKPPYVKSESGAAAPSEEAERVLDVFPDLGTRSRIDEALPDEPLAIGDRRDDLAQAVLRVMHPRAWMADRAVATLVRIEGGDAVFSLSLAARSTNAGKMDLTGDVRVRLQGASLASISLSGSYGSNSRFRYTRRVEDI